MIAGLQVGAFVRFETMIAAVLEAAARAVPVVVVADGVAMVAAFARPVGAS